MTDHFNFNHLYYFLTIANEGSITKASKKLLVTQPTLSTQLKQFEDMLGYQLFDRKKKRLYLNKKGEIVLNYAAQIFKLKDEMLENIEQREDKKNLMKYFTVGILPSLSKSHIFTFVEKLWEHDNVHVNIIEDSLTVLKKKIVAGKIDVLLSDTILTQDRKSLFARRIVSRDIIAVAHPKFKAYKRNFPQNLDKIPFMNVTEHSQFRKDIDSYFLSEGIIPKTIGEVDDINLLQLAAESGKCFVIVPKNAVLSSLRADRLIILGTLNHIHSDMWAITRNKAVSHPMIQETIEEFCL